MRIAMIVNSFPSLSEKFLLNQIVGLISLGIDVDIFAAVPSSDKEQHFLYQEYSLERRTFQLNIPTSSRKRFLKLPLLVVKNFFRNPFFTIKAFSVAKYHRTSRNLKTLFFLDAFYGKKYDLIHCQFGPNGLIGSFLKDCGFTDKLIVTFHGSDITVYPKKEGKDVYSYMFSRADAITAGTRFTSRLLIENHCPPEKVHIIPAGIISEKYPATLFSGRDKNLLLSVGRLQEVKGFQYSIRAFSLLAQSFPDLKYIIAGEGSERKKLEALIQEHKLYGRILLVGEKTDTEILSLYHDACIFIAPSVRASNGSEEGQGLVIQEAEMSGLPVIGAATGGIPDGILDNVTGFLVNEKDPEAIADKIKFLLLNLEIAQKMGAEGRIYAKDNYDVSILSKKIVTLYGTV